MTSQELHVQIEQYVEQQAVLLNVTRQLAASMSLNETIPYILDGAARGVRADSVRLLLAGPEGGWRAYAAGEQSDAMTRADTVLMDLVNQQGIVEIECGDVMPQRAEVLSLLPDVVAVIAIPLVAHQAQHGVLWAGFRSSHIFGDAERTFLAILAGQAAIAIANGRSFEAARRGREWLAAVLASTPDPVLVVDRDLRLQLVNPAAQDMFETPADQVIGQPLDRLGHAADLIDLFDEQNDQARRRIVEYSAENGQTYSPSVSPVRTEDGQMAGWVLVLRDISHFKRLNSNMSEFLSTVSHDMRSPLTFMKGYLDMLGMVGELNDRQNEFVDKIAVGVIQMSDMVEKILEAGKLDPVTGNYELSREPCDLVEIVQKVFSALSEPARKKGLELTCTVPDIVPVLRIDRAMMTSAFTNLVENAIKYTPDGGRVQIELQIGPDWVIFRVTDNGYGISPENQRKLFQRNVRIHRKEWKRVKGSGLGLFIVKNVAQRHGGDAWVESVEGQGSTFFLAIPLAGANLVGGEPGAAD